MTENHFHSKVDIPKIVDKRYLYIGGNKKVIKKQLIRLPIVKDKAQTVLKLLQTTTKLQLKEPMVSFHKFIYS